MLIQEIMQSPGAPNLYWALATIPDSLSDMTEEIMVEREVVRRITNWLAEPISFEATADQWRDHFLVLGQRFKSIYSMSGLQNVDRLTNEQFQFAQALYLLGWYYQSRSKLHDLGYEPTAIDQMSSYEAIVRAGVIDKRIDEIFKDALIPWEVTWIDPQPWNDRSKFENMNHSDLVFDALVPAIAQIKTAAFRSRNKRNLLISLAALQASLASNPSPLRESVGEIEVEKLKPLPIWEDLNAKRPFQVKRNTDGSLLLLTKPFYGTQSEIKLIVK
jgi:hypothetical protein